MVGGGDRGEEDRRVRWLGRRRGKRSDEGEGDGVERSRGEEDWKGHGGLKSGGRRMGGGGVCVDGGKKSRWWKRISRLFSLFFSIMSLLSLLLYSIVSVFFPG